MIYTNFIESTLLKASKIALLGFGKVNVSVKREDNNQVLTDADLAIGKLIVKEIQSKFPDHNVIDEEAGIIDKNSEFTWVVDPIDGTSNFANSLPHYGIMVGLLKGSLPIAGGISLPSFDQMYLAEKGNGTFCNGKPVKVTTEQKLINALVVYQIDGHQENPTLTKTECSLLSDIILSIRNLRTTSSAFDLAMVASGKYGAILNKTSKIWDNVAQQIIIEEAGGIYTDFYGKPMDYINPLKKLKDNFTYCAASPILHGQIMSIINRG